MKRIGKSSLLALLLVLLIDCGVGPKHLSTSNYNHGKTAFQMLQQYDAASAQENSSLQQYAPYRMTASTEMVQIPESSLRTDLENYQLVIDLRSALRSGLNLATIKVEEDNLNADSYRILHQPKLMGYFKSKADSDSQAMYDYRHALFELQPLFLLCSNQVAQYFDSAITATGVCQTAVQNFRTEYKKLLEE